MSAYILHPTPAQAAPAPDPEGIMAATQQLETALSVGREQVKKLREDFVGAQSRYLRSQQESERKLRDAQSREQQLAQSLEAHKQEAARRERVMAAEATGHRDRSEALQRDLDNALRQLEHERREHTRKIEATQQREEALKTETAALQTAREAMRNEISQLRARAAQFRDALDKRNGEIELYKTSWARVLKMEQDARAHLNKQSNAENRILALENRNIELLAEAKRRIRGMEANQRVLQGQLNKAQKEVTNAECALQAAEETRARLKQLEERLSRQQAEAEMRALRQLKDSDEFPEIVEEKSPDPGTPIHL